MRSIHVILMHLAFLDKYGSVENFVRNVGGSEMTNFYFSYEFLTALGKPSWWK